MASDRTDRKLLIGFLAGAGFGLAMALLLDPAIRYRLRALLMSGAGDVADRMASIGKGREEFHTRKEARADRTFRKHIDRMREAGF